MNCSRLFSSVAPKYCLALLAALCCLLSAGAYALGDIDLLTRPHKSPDFIIPYGKDDNQFGELWLPGGKPPYKVVVLIHGGCWNASLPGTNLLALAADDLRQHGVAVWSLEYRRISNGIGGYPDPFLDIANGMDFLRTIAAKGTVDLNTVVVVGHSAGGHLALWAAGRKRIPPTSPVYTTDDPLPVTRVVSLAGIGDLDSFKYNSTGSCGTPYIIDTLVKASIRPSQTKYRDTSPAAMLPLGVEQIMFAGDQDVIVPASFADSYAKKARDAGDKAGVRVLPGGHFDLIDPTSKAWPTIRVNILAPYGLE